MDNSRIVWAMLAFTLMFSCFCLADQRQASASAPTQSSAGTASGTPDSDKPVAGDAPASRKITAYTLPAELYKKAHDKSKIDFRLQLIGFVYGLVVLWIVLRWKLGATYRDWAERTSGRRFLQALIFSPLFLFTVAVLTLPLDIYSETIEKQYGISVQAWGSWGLDWVKAQLISIVIFTILIWILYIVIRRSPRRWWFYFWLVAADPAVRVFYQPLGHCAFV